MQITTNVVDNSVMYVNADVYSEDKANNIIRLKYKIGFYANSNYGSLTFSQVKFNNTRVLIASTKTIAQGDNMITEGFFDLQTNSVGTATFQVTAFSCEFSSYSASASPSANTFTSERKSLVKSVTNFTDDGATITLEQYLPTDLQVNVKDGNTTILTVNRSNVVSPYSLTFSSAEKNTIYNHFTSTINVSAEVIAKTTIASSTRTDTKNATLSILNANPIWTSPTYEDAASDVVRVTGNNQILVQNLSFLKLTWTSATGQKGATISNYKFYLGTTLIHTANSAGTYESAEEFAFANSLPITCTVTDSRGYVQNYILNPTVYEYTYPTITASAKRVNYFENSTKLKPVAKYSPVGTINSITVYYKKKEAGGTYGTATVIPNNVESTISLDNTKQYYVQIYCVDAFGSSQTTTQFVDKGKLPFFIDTVKRGVSVNSFLQSGEVARFEGGATSVESLQTTTGVAQPLLVETISQGIWQAKKYSDGTFEMIGTSPSSSYAFSYNQGGVWLVEGGLSIGMPLTPVSVDLTLGNIYSTTSGTHLWMGSVMRNGTNIVASLMSDKQVTCNCFIQLLIKGTWR